MKTHIHFKEPKCTDTNCQDGISVTAFGEYMGKCPHCNGQKDSAYGYREPKPKFNTKDHPDHSMLDIKNAWDKWPQTGIKIVEPEFKVGEEVYFNKILKVEIETIYEDGTIDCIERENKGERFCTDRRYLSHYYEGQNDIEFQHVRKVEAITRDKDYSTHRSTEWQPVKEPERHNYSAFDMDDQDREWENKVAQFQSQINQEEIQLIESKYLK